MAGGATVFEPVPGIGFVGTPMSGLVGGHPRCAECNHPHRRTVFEGERSHIYDSGCACGCVASGSTYEGDESRDIGEWVDHEDDGPSADLCPVRRVVPGDLIRSAIFHLKLLREWLQ